MLKKYYVIIIFSLLYAYQATPMEHSKTLNNNNNDIEESNTEQKRWLTGVFLIAAAAGNDEQVKKYISYDVDVNFRDKSGNTPLHYAVLTSLRNPEVIKILQEAGADVNAKNNDDLSYLQFQEQRSQHEKSNPDEPFQVTMLEFLNI